jgi:DNA primase
MAEGLDVSVVDLPSEHDPDSLVQQGGVAAWREVLDHAGDPIEFIQRHGIDAGRGETHALKAVVQLAAVVADPIRQKRLLERGAAVFGLAEPVLQRALDLERTGGGAAAQPIEAAVRARRHSEGHLERELLQALLLAPAALEETRARVTPDDFRDPEAAALARWLWSGDETEPPAEAAVLWRELAASADPDGDWARVAEANTRRMVQKRLERESQRVRQRLEQLQRQGRADDPETLELLQETQELHRTIRSLQR